MVKHILVSQPKPTGAIKSPYIDLAQKYNVEVDFEKFIKIEGVPAREFRRDKVNILDHTAVIFTSRNSVDHFFRMSKEMRIEVPETMKYFSISEATSYYLQKYVQYRKRKIFFGKQNFKDLLIFFSPSGVASLLKNFPDFEQGDTKIGVFGPTTAKAVKEAGFKLDLNAPTKTAPSMAMALDQFLEKTFKKNGHKVLK